MLSPFMNEIMLVSVSTEKDPGLVQPGFALSSARAICRFLKKISKTKCFAQSCEDLCGIALEIVQPRIALSLEPQPLRFQTLTLNSAGSTVNYDVRPVWPDLKQPSNKRPGKSDQKDQKIRRSLRSRTETPLELGAKMSDVLEEPKMDPAANQYSSHSLGYGWLRDPKTICHGLVTLLPIESRDVPKTRKGDPGKS